MMENINNKGGITLDGMMPNGLSASDVALLNNDSNFGGNGAYFWIFALLLLAGGGGFGWNNRNGDCVTEADLCTSQNF